MGNLEKIRQKIEALVQSNDLQLVDLKWGQLGHQKVLEISLANHLGTLDLEEASQITEPISKALDELEELNFEYLLDIGSPGIERELKSTQDLIENLNAYVAIEFTNHQEGINGTMIDVNEDAVTLKHFIKGRPKKSVIKRNEIKKIHLAVKF